MSSLVVRNLGKDILNRLKQWAAWHGRSDEAEHRAILKPAVVTTRRGVALVGHRAICVAGGLKQTRHLDEWLERVESEYADRIVNIDADIANAW